MEKIPVNQVAFIDQVCERLAVETCGVKIYEAILAKPALAALEEPAVLQRLRTFQRDEARHRDLLRVYLDRLGVTDVETPSARLARHEGEAFLRLIDEAQTAHQLLNILLTVELMDETAWEMLVNLGRDLAGMAGKSEEDRIEGEAPAASEIVQTFNAALREEKEHLRGVRGLVAQLSKEEIMAPEPLA